MTAHWNRRPRVTSTPRRFCRGAQQLLEVRGSRSPCCLLARFDAFFVVVVVLTDEKGVEARFMPISHTLSHPLTPSHTLSHPLTPYTLHTPTIHPPYNLHTSPMHPPYTLHTSPTHPPYILISPYLTLLHPLTPSHTLPTSSHTLSLPPCSRALAQLSCSMLSCALTSLHLSSPHLTFSSHLTSHTMI